MLKRIYAHNYKCLENFEFRVDDDEYYRHSSLLIGKNGSGKSTIGEILEIFQKIGTGRTNFLPVGDGPIVAPLIDSTKLNKNKLYNDDQSNKKIELEIEADIDDKTFTYCLSVELPKKFSHFRIAEESFAINGNKRFSRAVEKIVFYENQYNTFNFDWHSVYFPSYEDRDENVNHSLKRFRDWLKNIVVLSPEPNTMRSLLQGESMYLKKDASNIADWFANLIAENPDAYGNAKRYYLEHIMPDFAGLRNLSDDYGKKYLTVVFQNDRETNFRFEELSSGEKCIILATLILAAKDNCRNLLCFWDEPDNHLAASEIEHFIATLRKRFLKNAQIIMTTHSLETIERFPEENISILYRKNHASATRIKTVAEWRNTNKFGGNFTNALLLGNIEL